MSDTEIKSLPLAQRRKILGYLVPAMNIPLFLYNLYLAYLHLQDGMVVGDNTFWNDAIVLAGTAFIGIAIPRFFPVYTSKYYMKPEGMQLKRLLRKTSIIPYKNIDRVEVYIRVDEEISKDATDYATDQSSILRKSGFKFMDYTNGEDTIVNLFVEKSVYMISPDKPKALLKELKRRNKRLTARIVELTKRGKKIQDLA